MGLPRDKGSYVGWEEVVISGDKGRCEVRYYLRTTGGKLILAVVGKEKSYGHMSYCDAMKTNGIVLSKLESRRDVVDWLNSVVADELPHQPFLSSGFHTAKDGDMAGTMARKDAKFRKVGHYSKAFSWIGAPTCRKRKKHYASFCRNGVKISIHDFVYVLAEEGKRLVAYLEDLYEDSRENKMVVVRWFHKIDEVGFVLPHSVNDREIFFSLCIQDIKVECIDGLAAILSPLHYEKYQMEAARIYPDTFVCQKIFDNDGFKPFDITQVKGYWKQKILKHLYGVSGFSLGAVNEKPDYGQELELSEVPYFGVRPKKKSRLSKDGVSLFYAIPPNVIGEPCAEEDGRCIQQGEALPVSITDEDKKKCKQVGSYLKVGSEVEVLSEDSGIRGCWFKALIIKKRKDNLKVQYHELQDAADEHSKLEEWVSASRIASSNEYGLRIGGRTQVRPCPDSCEGAKECAIEVGTVVDVLWCDGWWEGIVVQKGPEDSFKVYLPGEKVFSRVKFDRLRHSREWVGHKWTAMRSRPDLVGLIMPSLKDVKGGGCNEPIQVSFQDISHSTKKEAKLSDSHTDFWAKDTTPVPKVPNLLKDASLSQLKWNSAKKRKRGGGCFSPKPHADVSIRRTHLIARKSSTAERTVIHASLKVDRENCKSIGDSLLSPAVVPSLTSLVMSR